MGKPKKKNRNRKHLADRVAVRKKEKDITSNPFELHFNRQKHHVIGRRSKQDHGLPGVARTKALKKRKETLLQEYRQQFKNNKFIDRRIGENDPSMAPEDKMVARYAAERKTKKVNIFNLNEEEELTHFGQSLSEIEKFDDPRSDDEEDDGALAGEFMKESHFGGFLTKKENSNIDEKPKSRKEWIEELISTSKQKKHERQSGKEETQELTDKLDSEWKDVRLLMSAAAKKAQDTQEVPIKADSYDILVRSLKFDGRAKATDRLKTPEELALEEKEKLEKLEADRINRMKGVFEETSKEKRASVHRSADDLEDNFALEDQDSAEAPYELRYKDGELVVPLKPESTLKETSAVPAEDEEGSDEDDVPVQEDDEASGSEDASDTDSYRDIHSDDDDDNDDDNNEHKAKFTKAPSISIKKSDKLQKQARLMQKAREELPYTFPAPEKYDDFADLVSGHTSAEQAVIVERIIKCHHPSLADGNNSKLETLFAILLQHVNDLAAQDPPALGAIDKLVPALYQLTTMSRTNAGKCVLEVIIEKHDDFRKSCKQKFSGVRGDFPTMDTLIFFKLVSTLFSTSDFRHPVVTPTILFMGQILTQCPTKTRRDVATGLYICSLFFEFISYSKRLVPEALNYLCGILSLSIGNDPKSKAPIPISPPFKIFASPVLKLEESSSGANPQALKMDEMATEHDFTDEFRMNAVWVCCELLKEFATIYQSVPSFLEIFKPIQVWLGKMELTHYPPVVKETVDALNALLTAPHPLQSLVRERRKPQSVRFYEPKFEETFTGQKHGRGKQVGEKQRLLHKYKQEMKGAMREIRKDNQFLARQQLDDTIERDNERKRKVKELYQSLSVQEGDYKKLVKEKKKRK